MCIVQSVNLSVHDGADKVLVVDVATVILVTCKQGLRLLVRQLLPKGGQQVAQLRRSDKPVTVLVEVPEPLDEIVTGIRGTTSTNCLHDWKEDLEGDPVVGTVLVHELLHLGLRRVLPQGAHHVSDLINWDLAISPLVVQKEGFLEFRDLIFAELDSTRHDY